MNETMKTILNHRSIRKFKDQPLAEQEIEQLVHAAQMASTSSYIQAYSIIGVENKQTKAELATLAGNQPYVEQNGHFFVFCADLYRHTVAAEMEDLEITPAIESTEKFMVAVIDASLAAQNAAVAAESLGLGICYIGGLRNEIEKVSELLQLPEYVIPLFGMAVGVPDAETDQKPRLPLENVYYKETYPNEKQKVQQGLENYNETISAYYHDRTDGKRSDRWTEQMSNMLKTPRRMHMKDFVQGKGFMKS
ncbi:oxygen-insensitive NADPH nitroreductase [Salipaludibacillus keqinensis]|uniref:Oxygen-insensitive NADPH nitroreductase n=1 Tax=Salipaludibacillus keqinensis TaxID=2045207 RepID=A0A323TD81_9BACI|nr:oxygen-insensitive NADPH nitroreductase [Salipaludibacillus keqinensis]PYZ93332.1 oxygen-insensitive NADPH nitroreductase [Salipaludibacillus keqinensis]